MLVLTRAIGKTVMIGDDIQITILSARGQLIRIGIDAPKNIEVHREEIYRQLKGEARLPSKK